MMSNKNLTVLPQGWIVTSLQELTHHHSGNSKLIKGKMHKKYVPELYPAFSATGQDVWRESYEYEGDAIIISAVGARCGKCFLASGRWSAVANTHIVWPISEVIDLRFLWYRVNDERFWIRSGTAQPFVKAKDTFELPFLLPPIAEQKQIVSKIEELFTKLDAGVKALKRVQQELKRYRQAVLKYAFEGKLTEKWREKNRDRLEPASKLLERIAKEREKSIKGKAKKLPKLDTSELPKGWEWASLGGIAEINVKPNSDHLADDTKVSFLPMRCVEALTGEIDLSIEKTLAEVKKGYTSFLNGDLLFAKITPCMENGKVAIADDLKNGIGFGSTEFHTIRLPETLPRKLFFYFLIQEGFRKDAQRNMTGTAGQLRVPKKHLQQVAIPFAPTLEQQQIVQKIERHFSIADQIEQTIEQGLKQSERLRQSILEQAFEGKLVPQDPSGEPAEKLLERIKAERKKVLRMKRNRAAK